MLWGEHLQWIYFVRKLENIPTTPQPTRLDISEKLKYSFLSTNSEKTEMASFARKLHVMIMLLTSWALIFIIMFLAGSSTTEESYFDIISRASLLNQTQDEDQEKDRPSKLGDGCYHVFLDIGANVGVHGRFIYEPHKYPYLNAKTTEIFTQFFGDPKIRDPRNICVFAFEPNPAHQQRHLDLKEAYGKAGLRYYPIMAGVSDQNGNLTFYHQDGGKNEEWGFSATKNTKVRSTEVTLPVVRLSSWLRDHILGRRIPAERPMLNMIGDTAAPAESTTTTVPMNATSMPPSVIGKMDVEGMEFIMLADLLYSGILCQTVDYLFGEFHHRVDFKAEPDKETKRGGYIKTKKNTYFLDTLLEGLHSLRNDDCKLKKFDMHDDEAYLTDGAVLPESVWWEEAHNKK